MRTNDRSPPDPPPVKRIRGRELQRRRAALFARSPWCVKCLLLDITIRATIRSLVLRLEEGGLDDETNEEALCVDCFDDKKAEEARRGVYPRSALTDRFRKSATPRDETGRFTLRRRRL